MWGCGSGRLRLGLGRPGFGPSNDVLDDGPFGPGVIVHVRELLTDEPALDALLKCAFTRGLAQPVPEHQVSAVVVRSGLPDMNVDVTLRSSKHAVPGIPDAQFVARPLHGGEVAALIIGIIDCNHTVNERLGRETGNRRGAHMLNAPGDFAERFQDPNTLPSESTRPCGRVVHQDQLPLFAASDQHGIEVPVEGVVGRRIHFTAIYAR